MHPHEYTISIREDDDPATRWLYGVPGATPALAAHEGYHRARGRGYAVGRCLVRVWAPDCRGSTINHEPLAEYQIPQEGCECSRLLGVPPCTALAEITIEHMPVHLRAGHEEARNRGAYPHNGAVRLRVSRECAGELIDGDWTTLVEAP